MASAGHEVAAVVWPDDVIHQALAADGRIRLFAARFRARNDVRGTLDVARAVRAARPEWLVGSFKREYWPVATVSCLTRVPAVVFAHLDQRMNPVMARGLPRVVHRIVAPSMFLRERLVARGVPAARVAVLPNPIDTAHLRITAEARLAARARLGFAPTTWSWDSSAGWSPTKEPTSWTARWPTRWRRSPGYVRSGSAAASWLRRSRSDGPELRSRGGMYLGRGAPTCGRTTPRSTSSRCHRRELKRSAASSLKRRRARCRSWVAGWAGYPRRSRTGSRGGSFPPGTHRRGRRLCSPSSATMRCDGAWDAPGAHSSRRASRRRA